MARDQAGGPKLVMGGELAGRRISNTRGAGRGANK
jgi:hypothetical protein